jgi:hypothetical protein
MTMPTPTFMRERQCRSRCLDDEPAVGTEIELRHEVVDPLRATVTGLEKAKSLPDQSVRGLSRAYGCACRSQGRYRRSAG